MDDMKATRYTAYPQILISILRGKENPKIPSPRPHVK